ncbi:MAG: lysylphosphatidylglycerol synthase transmembrane domain-containing protein [Candidatus Margulisiibacteriota bacterium]
MKRFSVFLGILISLALLFLLFYRINLSQFLAAFQKANYYYAFLIIVVVFAGCYLRALRWRWIIRPLKDIPAASLFIATVIGYMANSLLPARMGEFVRAHVIGRREGISRAASFATIIVERLFDGLSILVILVLILFWIEIPIRGALIAAAWSALVLYLLIIAVIILFIYKKELVLKLFGFVFRFLPERAQQRFLSVVGSLAQGFKIAEKGHHLLIIIFYSFLIWIVTALGIYLIVLAFGYQISYPAAMFILVLLTFAVMLPSSPGFVGTFEAGMVYGLMIFNLPRETALSAALVFHGLSFIPIILLGFYYLWKYKLSIR